MPERAYQWTMAAGSRLLFTLAVILFVVALIGAVISTFPSAHLNTANGLIVNSFDWQTLFSHLYLVFEVPVLPLIGALIVHHLEKRANGVQRPLS